MPQLKRWALDFWYWLAEANLVFMGGFVILAAILFAFFTWPSQSSIRISGYGLQLIGIIFAIRGLLLVRLHFGQPPMRAHLLKWLQRFPKWRKGATVRVDPGHSIMTAKDPYVEIWTPDDPEKTLEHRLNAAIRNLYRLRSNHKEHANLISTLRSDLENFKEQVSEENTRTQKDLRSDMESLHTNDLATSLVGLVWLLVGTTMSTLAPELSILVHKP